MRLVCAPSDYQFQETVENLAVVLYGLADSDDRGSAGAALTRDVYRQKLSPAEMAWDLMSLALSVTAADLAGHRSASPDGWTRELDLEIAVADPDFWNAQAGLIQDMLGFLTTDRWDVRFMGGGIVPVPPTSPELPTADCVSLLSGGLDSFVGNIDLAARGVSAMAVSQTVKGDAQNQRLFAQVIGGGLKHLQINHNAAVPNPDTPPTQRARSLIFVAHGVLAATSLERYRAGADVPLYMCENGFISLNPPLTDARLGSLSTRTTHPHFLRLLQELLDAAGLRVRLDNPYQLKTKGQMLDECLDNTLLGAYATKTTSCGRYLRFGHSHCGRCVPCLVRRAAFRAASMNDSTRYKYVDLGRDDEEHARFDDVRSAAMAVAAVESDGLDSWLGASMNTALLGDVQPLKDTASRGLSELGELLRAHGVL